MHLNVKYALKFLWIHLSLQQCVVMSYLSAAHVSVSGTVGMGDLIRVAQIVESRGYAQNF